MNTSLNFFVAKEMKRREMRTKQQEPCIVHVMLLHDDQVSVVSLQGFNAAYQYQVLRIYILCPMMLLSI